MPDSGTVIFPSLVLYYKSACSYYSCRRHWKVDVPLLFRKVLIVQAGSCDFWDENNDWGHWCGGVAL